MIFKIYSEDSDTYSFKKVTVPDKINAVHLFWNKNASKDGIGSIEIEWRSPDLRFGVESETIYINCKAFILVNDKTKFVINDKNDMFNFYKYLTNEDINFVIKDFQTLEKENKLGKDF